MKQLRNFSAQNKNNRSNASEPENGNVSPESLMNEAMKKYGNMDENALLNQLVSGVRAQRSDGTYDEGQLLSFANSISPYLDEAQRKKLENIICMISSQNGQG